MPLPRDPSAYPLELELLNIALTRNERLEYELATKGAATHFRQRLNRVRQLLRAEGDHKYNNLTFGLEGKKVIVDFVKAVGLLRNEKGEEIALIAPPTKAEMQTAVLAETIEDWSGGLDLSILEGDKDV